MNDQERLWIWVVGWDKFQGRRDRAGLPWFRVYSDLAGNDDWLELRPVDRTLLIGIWMDINRWGNGRVSANLRALRGRHNVTRASLEPLIQAGFIEVSTTKGPPIGHQMGALDEMRGTTSLKKEKENARAAPEEPGARAQNGEPPLITAAEAAELEAIARQLHPEAFHD